MGASVLESPQTLETAIETMRAVVVHSFDAAPRVEEVAKPVAGPDEIVVKIEASGLCHTDIHAVHGDWPVKPKLPSRLGTRVSESWRRSVRASRR
jgi:hypothetical protein